jgi:mono/diheme cytochrome c family protein
MKKVMPITCLFLLLFVVSCKHEIPTSITTTSPVVSPPTVSTSCSADTVYYKNVIEPLIISGCTTSGCHNDVSRADGIVLTTYTNIIAYVSAGNASNSKLYKVLVKTGNERMPLPPLPAFTTTQIALVQKWINQGAKNNACNACDTTDFKYSTAIQPLIQTNCVGCHSAASPGGGINLSTYALVKACVVSGRFYGSIAHSTGFSPMPKGTSKMPDCQVTQFKKWIDAGSPNN